MNRLLLLISLGISLSSQSKEVPNYESVSAEISREFRRALEAYKGGEHREAQSIISDAYFDIFEGSGMEQAVGAQSSSLKTDLENTFNQLRSIAAKGPTTEAGLKELSTRLDTFQARIQAVGYQLSSPQSFWESFLSSLTIIFREGFEAILVIGAIVAFLVKSGNSHQLKIVRDSVLCALGLSLVTAFVFSYILKISAAQQELLEGLTMLVACAMLFTVGHWLVSKAESNNWQKYIRNKLSSSLSEGSRRALWFTCFLAVFREGAETVLFYQALFSSTQKSGYSAIAFGFVSGTLLLAVLYWGLRKGMVKIPLKAFFRVTSAMLYLLAIIFAGKAVVELQAGGYLGVTELRGWPTLSVLGFYPTLQSLLLQAFFVLAFAISLTWVWLQKHFFTQPKEITF